MTCQLTNHLVDLGIALLSKHLIAALISTRAPLLHIHCTCDTCMADSNVPIQQQRAVRFMFYALLYCLCSAHSEESL